MSADGKAIGTIEIKDAIIQTPAGGKVIDYRNKEELSDGIVYEAGQTIGTGDATIDSPYDAAVAKSTVIVPPEETKPEEKHGKTKPEGSKSEGTKTTKTVAVAAKGAKTVGKLAATGDTSNAAIVQPPCGNSRHRRRRPGESQTFVNTFSHRTGGSQPLPSPSTSS